MGLATGCSAVRLGYGQGPALAYWWLDGYLDFDGPQAARAKDALGQWFQWHQGSELPLYAAHLSRLQAEASRPVTGPQVCRWFETLRDALDPSLAQILPPAAELALSLSPAQLDRLERQQQAKTAEHRERLLQPDAAARRRAAVERAVENYERFYGTLDPAQRRAIEDGVRRSPFDPNSWLATREARNRELLDTLRGIVRERPPQAQVRERLRGLFERVNGRVPIARAEDSARLTAHNCELTAQVHNTAGAAQQRHLQDKLKAWENDFRLLAADATASAVARTAAR